ncbi:MAG: bifunctional phosphoribosylaminoimidazolecarboxamide formyltransferase/IMP cyclohydrolase [Bacteroidota bacterium]
MSNKKIKSALVSVFHKDNLDQIILELHKLGVIIYSTGGTQKFIEDLGVNAVAVEDVTSYPSILGGRVKTLHPKVFGGILGRRANARDIEEMQQYEIPEIDLVIVDLYPFEKTVATTNVESDIIEKIDIGGISLIRAAAKNFNDVIIVPSSDNYEELYKILTDNDGVTTLEDRRRFASYAFNVSSHYDTAIFNYFNQDKHITTFKQSISKSKSLRYGENPHQSGVFYGDFDAMFDQIWGIELSYNNLLDVDAGINLIAEFKEPTIAILKHNNACGLASRSILKDAWKDALAGDPVSAFGGVIVTNTNVDFDTAKEINDLFFEIIIAPSYDQDALDVFKTKKNRRILIQKKSDLPKKQVRTLLNGILEQDRDFISDKPEGMKVVTTKVPTSEQISDLEFANKIVKHTKSNAMVIAKNKQLIASGVGQTSRVDAMRQAIDKAHSFKFDLKGAVLASDAFFPFPDNVELAFNEGIMAVVQPGGSINDKLSIEFCEKNGMAMVFTGNRHFKH